MRVGEHRHDTRLIEILFGKYRRGILSLLLSHPDESFYVREIARLSATPAGSLHRELKALTRAGLLVRSVSGNQVRYQADRTCPIFEELAGIFRKTMGLTDVLREALAPLAGHIRVAFVFGSAAAGTERPQSDVDIMVVGDASFESVVHVLSGTRDQLRRDVNPVVMTARRFRANARSGDRFVTRVLSEPKLFLAGDTDELGKLVEDRPAQGAPA